MGQAEVISLSEVCASKQWAALRHQLHDRFDQWLDQLEAQLPEPETTLAHVTETVWNLRQELTGGLTETLVDHVHQIELTRKELVCATCDRLLAARPAVSRTVDTMVGSVQLEGGNRALSTPLCRQLPILQTLSRFQGDDRHRLGRQVPLMDLTPNPTQLDHPKVQNHLAPLNRPGHPRAFEPLRKDNLAGGLCDARSQGKP